MIYRNLFSVDCGPPPIVVSPLAVTYNDTVVGSIASYTCINGYVIDGYATSSRVCQDNGIWSDVNVHCIGKYSAHIGCNLSPCS